jgi:glutathione S-transferase
MDAVLRQVDEELKAGGGPYFLGEELSLVDCMFAPFLERMAASLPYFKGLQSRGSSYPHLLKWYEAMDARDTYAALKSDYYTHCHDLPPQIGQCHSLPAAAPFAAEIDGGSWRLDFTNGIEPMVPSDIDVARREAAQSLLSNLDKVARFSARGAGEKV